MTDHLAEAESAITNLRAAPGTDADRLHSAVYHLIELEKLRSQSPPAEARFHDWPRVPIAHGDDPRSIRCRSCGIQYGSAEGMAPCAGPKPSEPVAHSPDEEPTGNELHRTGKAAHPNISSEAYLRAIYRAGRSSASAEIERLKGEIAERDRRIAAWEPVVQAVLYGETGSQWEHEVVEAGDGIPGELRPKGTT